jgi:hypothetical protein
MRLSNLHLVLTLKIREAVPPYVFIARCLIQERDEFAHTEPCLRETKSET